MEKAAILLTWSDRIFQVIQSDPDHMGIISGLIFSSSWVVMDTTYTESGCV